MATIPTAALVRRGMELISNLVAMIDARASLNLRSDMAEFIVHMIHILDSANHNNAAVDAVAQQLRDRLCVVHKLSLYPPTGPQLNRIALKEFKNLSELYVNQCPPTTIVDLCEIRGNLTTLIVTNSGIVDIADVLASHAPKKLRSRLPPIILQDSKVSIPMKYCWTNLTKLSLSNCGIVRMDEVFHFFPFLTHLDLSNNDITHVVHLHDCVSLESLNLSYNRIRVLSNLERVIGRVKKINLAHNDIESLDGLDKIYALEKVNLSFNYIDDMAEVQHLCRLPNLEAVYLADNPIAELGNYRLRFYREFIVNGTIMNGNRPFPSLDRIEITKKERKKLRKLMFRAPVDALRESSYNDNPDIVNEDFYEDDDEDGRLTAIDEDNGDGEGPSYETNRDSFFNGASTMGREALLLQAAVGGGDGNNRYSMRFSVDRTSSTAFNSNFHSNAANYGQQSSQTNSPTKMRQSSVIAPHFFRTVSTVRSSSTLGMGNTVGANSNSNNAAGPGFMAKRKFTKRTKRVAAIADSDEPEVYPKLQEVLTQIALRKEQELQLQRAQEVMEKALKVIQISATSTNSASQETKDSAATSGPQTSSLSPAQSVSGTRTPPNPRYSNNAATTSALTKQLEFPMPNSVDTSTTNRQSLRLDSTSQQPPLLLSSSMQSSSLLLSSSMIPDAILFPRDLDPKLRVSEQLDAPPFRLSSLSRTHSRDLLAQQSMNQNHHNNGLPRSSSSSSGHDEQAALLLASMDPYIGDPQYKSLNIADNLELYFREQVFNPKRPSYPQIYLHEDLGKREKLPAGLQHALCLIAAYHPDERLVTMFCEKVIDLTALENASRRGTSGTASAAAASGNHGSGPGMSNSSNANSSNNVAGLADDDDDDNVATSGGNNLGSISPEKAMTIVLSDHALYFISMEEISPQYTFADAPVFTVLAHYPLYQLSVCTIYFGFQRCTLTFSHPPPSSKSSNHSNTNNGANSPIAGSAPTSAPNSPSRPSKAAASATTVTSSNAASSSTMGTIIARYMIITREKSRAYPVITRVPQIANQIRNHHQPTPLTNVKIENKDSQLIEQVMRYIQAQGDHDVVYYQMCFQTRSKAPNVFLPRSLILTQSLILLCYEELTSSEVQLNVLECWKLKDIHKIAVDESNQMQVILTFAKRTNVIGNRKKWRISTDSRNASSKLLEELRRACNDMGNLLT